MSCTIWKLISKKLSGICSDKILRWDGLMLTSHSRNQVSNLKYSTRTSGFKCWDAEWFTTLFSKKVESRHKEAGRLVWDFKDSPWSCSKYQMWDFSGRRMPDFWTSSKKDKLPSLSNSASTQSVPKISPCGHHHNTIPTICSKSSVKSEEIW